MHRLEADGLLTSEQRVVEGRTRRVYAATEAGKEALEVDRHTLRELAREVLGHDLPGPDEAASDSAPSEESAADAVGGGADGQHHGSGDH
ncbi:PadR family transcriptional regulator [Streptomyces sp. NPDC055056]